MYSPVGFGSYGDSGLGQPGFTMTLADCGCPVNPKTGQPGVCKPEFVNQSEAATGITYDDKGCPVLQFSDDGKVAEILVDESQASATAKEFIKSTRARPGINVVSHQSWFAALPVEHKLAVAGIGFGMLLVLIYAIKS